VNRLMAQALDSAPGTSDALPYRSGTGSITAASARRWSPEAPRQGP